MQEVERFNVNGLTVRIAIDEYPESPREWDNLGTMVCWHRRHKLGDKHSYSSPEEFEADMKDTPHIKLPLYLYDHSGITMSTGAFSCPWDSGQVGWIYVTLDNVRNEYSVKRVSKKTREQAIECLTGEVKTYDEFLTGQVYGFIVEDEDGEEIDSCWGFYGLEYCKEEAKSSAGHHTPKAEVNAKAESLHGAGI